MSHRHEMDSAVMGFHVYKLIWTPVEREYYNGHGTYAVAVKKDGVVVGHLPRMQSATFWEQFYHL